MTERRLVRVQEKGQVTLPVAVRRRLGIKKGDLVAVVETKDGVLIMPQKVLAAKALDHIGGILRERGLTLEQLMKSGQEIRRQIARKKYGTRPGKMASEYPC